MLIVDLCCGMGGFSRSFKDAGCDVVTVDVEERFKPTIVADVCHLPFRQDLKPDVLLASPPCQYFSVASGHFPRIGIKRALELVGACFEAVAWLKPKWYLIENPRDYLRGIIGKPRQTIRYSDYDWDFPTQKPTDLWGNLPLPMVKGMRRPSAPRGSNRLRNALSNASLRAQIPLGVSEAILESVIS